MARTYDDIINQGFSDDLAALDEQDLSGRAERRRTNRMIDEELDDPVEFRDWYIYDKK